MLWADTLYQPPAASYWQYQTTLLAETPRRAMEEVDVYDPEGWLVSWAGEANAWVCSYILKDDELLLGDRNYLERIMRVGCL